MAWSQLKAQFESLIADSLASRLNVHLTAYERKNPLYVGRGWFTLDGEEIVSVQIPSFYSDNFRFSVETLDFGDAVYEFINSPFEQSVKSGDELVQAFVYIDRRFGKRRLSKVNQEVLHPFAKALFAVRCRAEGIEIEDAPDDA